MQRNDYMDFLKGICILSVITGHSISTISEMSIFFNIIYSFHMPLLIFISAYIEEQAREKYECHFPKMLLKRAQGLLIPYLTWNLISCVRLEGKIQFQYTDFGNRLTGNIQTGLWFLIVLFGLKCAHVCYWFLQKKFRLNSLLINLLWMSLLEIMIIILAAITKTPYLINMVSYAIPYFCGILWVGESLIHKLFSMEGTALLAFTAYAIVFQTFDFHNTAISTQIIRIFLSVCVIILCCKYQDSWQKNSPWKNMLCLFGRYSLEIYLLHGYFLDYTNLLQRIDSVWLAESTAVLMGIGVALTCILMTKVIRISKYSSKILFGK